jgi:hypothetical protein
MRVIMTVLAGTSPMVQSLTTRMSSDMRFVGIFYIIAGALYSLTIIGAIIGIPLIISGLRVRESADAFSSYAVSGDSSLLERALDKQSRFFFIQKVFMIITLAFFVLYIIILIVFGATLFSSMGAGY